MPSQTITTSGASTIALADRKDFVINSLWSAGGNGDTNPGSSSSGSIVRGSIGGGGGACLDTVPIPNSDILTAIVNNNASNLDVVLGSPGSTTSIGFGGVGIVLSPGENGSVGSIGTSANGGDLLEDDFNWITNQGTMLGPGGSSDDGSNAIATGYGAGAAGGKGGVVGNSGEDGTGGAAAASGGKGGNGGAANGNGQAGGVPGGGGGGAGPGVTGTRTGGSGGRAEATVSWTAFSPPTITSSSTLDLALADAHDQITTITTTGNDADFVPVFGISGGANSDLFTIDSGNGLLSLISPIGSVGTYSVEISVTTANSSTPNVLELSVVVGATSTDPCPIVHNSLIEQDDPAAFIYNLQREQLI